MEKILFVCNANRLRSPTAEKIYKKRKDISVKSAGLFSDAFVTVSQDIVDWADLIFVMEKNQQNKIIKKFKNVYNKKPVINLNISDDYEYMEPTLIELLSHKLSRFIGKPVI